MKSFVTALVLVALAAGSALANQCPALQAQIDRAIGNRFDASAANARSLASQAMALHNAGKHDESVAKYDEAAKAAGITLQKK
jgi:opacity protein-like surface antigen